MKKIEIQTDLGPIPVVLNDDIPMNAVLSVTNNGKVVSLSWYVDGNNGHGRFIHIDDIDYQQMLDDWEQYGDYLYTYRKTLDTDRV